MPLSCGKLGTPLGPGTLGKEIDKRAVRKYRKSLTLGSVSLISWQPGGLWPKLVYKNLEETGPRHVMTLESGRE